MTDFAEWLLEQIAYDERIAVAARDAPPDFLEVGSAEEQHLITLMDYDRVLAECDAKRRIVGTVLWFDGYDRGSAQSAGNEMALGQRYKGPDEADAYAGENAMRYVLAVLALPYADRAGYLEEWRP